MKKFEESDCANDCMEIQKLKGRVNLAGTVITLLLGSLLAANAFIYLTLSQVTVQIAQIAAYQTSQKERDVDQQASIEWLMSFNPRTRAGCD